MAWQSPPKHPNPLRRIAVHEAGHVILMRSFGLESPKATIVANEKGWHGEALFPDREALTHPDATPPEQAAAVAPIAAAMFHAGVIAEMIDSATPWTGPIYYPSASDFQMANEMLRPAFGNLASGAHAFAQRVALHLLAAAWAEVEAITDELMRTGTWLPPTQKVLLGGGAVRGRGAAEIDSFSPPRGCFFGGNDAD